VSGHETGTIVSRETFSDLRATAEAQLFCRRLTTTHYTLIHRSVRFNHRFALNRSARWICQQDLRGIFEVREVVERVGGRDSFYEN
jgi:hypothetical protein